MGSIGIVFCDVSNDLLVELIERERNICSLEAFLLDRKIVTLNETVHLRSPGIRKGMFDLLVITSLIEEFEELTAIVTLYHLDLVKPWEEEL